MLRLCRDKRRPDRDLLCCTARILYGTDKAPVMLRKAVLRVQFLLAAARGKKANMNSIVVVQKACRLIFARNISGRICLKQLNAVLFKGRFQLLLRIARGNRCRRNTVFIISGILLRNRRFRVRADLHIAVDLHLRI